MLALGVLLLVAGLYLYLGVMFLIVLYGDYVSAWKVVVSWLPALFNAHVRYWSHE